MIANVWEYRELPLPFLEDCRLVMEGEAQQARQQASDAERKRR